jgi:hypothetical protein
MFSPTIIENVAYEWHKDRMQAANYAWLVRSTQRHDMLQLVAMNWIMNFLRRWSEQLEAETIKPQCCSPSAA